MDSELADGAGGTLGNSGSAGVAPCAQEARAADTLQQGPGDAVLGARAMACLTPQAAEDGVRWPGCVVGQNPVITSWGAGRAWARHVAALGTVPAWSPHP